MAITSESKEEALESRFAFQRNSAQFRYAMTYVILTSIVLLSINIFSAKISQTLFYQSKEAFMMEKCELTAKEIGNLEVLNHSTIIHALSHLDSLKVKRLIVTDRNGMCIFDSYNPQTPKNHYILFPEIVESLTTRGNMGYDVFTWNYKNGVMQSRAAMPIISYGALVGCVYMADMDVSQGKLIQTLQKTILYITLIVEIAVIIFSALYSQSYTKRMRMIMSSMRRLHGGDYSHPVSIGGHDELTILGDEFNDLLARLNESEEKRNNFVSDASHELKTPLASIKLLSDSILQNEMDSDMIKEFVADIGNEAERLNKMSQKLLSLSKAESDEECDCEIVDVAPTAERVIRMLSENAKTNNITISKKLEKNCPILILEDDLYQILFNLVENGIKYNVPGGSLTISVYRKADNAVITVKDTGMGIPEGALEHIFERFYRVDKARARKTGGSGLGLSIVRSMVEKNSGNIAAQSTEGKGTTFIVSFPIFDTEEPS